MIQNPVLCDLVILLPGLKSATLGREICGIQNIIFVLSMIENISASPIPTGYFLVEMT